MGVGFMEPEAEGERAEAVLTGEDMRRVGDDTGGGGGAAGVPITSGVGLAARRRRRVKSWTTEALGHA